MTTRTLVPTLAAWMLALAGTAEGAPGSFSASLKPEGSAAAGQPVDIKLKFTAKTDAAGPVAARKIAMALPEGFSSNLAQYATCDRKQVIDKGPDDCPRASIVGSAVLSVVVPSLQIRSTSDRAVIVNLGGGKLIMWFKATKPVDYVGTVDATVAEQRAPYGPTVTWDFTPYTDGSPETRTVALEVTFPRGDAASSVPASTGTSERKTTKRKKTSKRKTRRARAACERRARRIKNRSRRAAARRKCRAPSRKKRATARAAAARSTFSAGECPAGGTWRFAAQVDYRDGRSSHEATVTCGSGSEAPPADPKPAPGEPNPGTGLCVPPLPPCAIALRSGAADRGRRLPQRT